MTTRAHGTLDANVEQEVVLSAADVTIRVIEVGNAGGALVYFTIDGSEATVRGNGTYVVYPDQLVVVDAPAATSVTVRLIADGSSVFSTWMGSPPFQPRRTPISQRSLQPDNETLEISGGALRLKDDAVSLGKLAQAAKDALNGKVPKPASPVAFTQTYSTTSATVPNPPGTLTFVAPTNLNEAIARIETLRQAVNTDRTAIQRAAELVNQIIDILQTGSMAS